MKFPTIAGLCLVLSACAEPLPLSPGGPVKVSPVVAENAEGLDVYAALRETSPDLPKYRGDTTILIRAFLDSDGLGDGREIADARCKISAGDLYTAEISSPQEIVVPNYGRSSPEVGATCSKDFLSGQASAVVYNERTRRIHDASASAGLVGIVAGAVFAAVTESVNDPYLYLPLSVAMK